MSFIFGGGGGGGGEDQRQGLNKIYKEKHQA